MKTFIVNLDYEWVLYGNKLPLGRLRKIQREFEFAFFFIEKENSNLFSEYQYPEDYLKKISDFKVRIPGILHESKEKINWWGELKNIEDERKINSKLTSLSISKELSVGPQNVIIAKTLSEVSAFISSETNFEEFIIKDPNSMGGQGNIVFYRDEFRTVTPKIKTLVDHGPIIVSPFFKRKNDYGAIINLKNSSLSVTLNFNTKFGLFRGGMICNEINWPEHFKNKELINRLKEQFLQLEISNEEVQFDSFTYIEQGEIKSYPLVEINYRKTMGHLTRSLHSLFFNKFSQPILLIFYRQDFVDGFEPFKSHSIFDELQITIISPEYVTDQKTKQLFHLDNMFAVMPKHNLISGGKEKILEYIKPNSSTFILLNEVISFD